MIGRYIREIMMKYMWIRIGLPVIIEPGSMLGLMEEKLYHDLVIWPPVLAHLKYKTNGNILCGQTCDPDIKRFNVIEFTVQLLNPYLFHIYHEVQFYP